MDNSVEPIRLAHFSDIHLTAAQLGWRPSDLLSKRVTGWFNLRVKGRGKLFDRAEEVTTVLMAELREQQFDRVIFSGDATALGFEAEHARAAEFLGLNDPEPLPGLAVPGNHDYYVRDSVRMGSFERHFAPWLTGERVGEQTYPFAQRVGPFWLVAVNTSQPNVLPHDASGETGADQLERLGRLLKQLSPGPRILVTHYPICLATGEAEKPSHALRDLDKLIEVAASGGIGLWLHGHRHHAYHLPEPPQAPFPVICAGSATQRGIWSYMQYTITGQCLAAVRREFDSESGKFQTRDHFNLEMPSRDAVRSARL